MKSILYNFLFALYSLIIIISCATKPTSTEPRIPIQNPDAQRYQTDDVLREKIAKLELQLATSPNDQEILLRLASLYQEVKEYDLAIEKMEHLKSMDYRDDPRLYGSLAAIYQKQENFTEAKANYLIFKSLLSTDSPTVSKVDKKIERLDFIMSAFNHPYKINLRPFSADINTKNSEYLPQFTMDDSTIIFTRRFFEQEDLFIAHRTNEGYTVEAIDEVNTLSNEGAHTLSADGSLLIFTHCDEKFGYGSCDLYRSHRTPIGKWTKPTNMGKTINSRNWESQPSLSADGKTLYFTSRRENGAGGSDIYVTKKLKNGRWGKPQNIGSKINTKANDESPFIHADGQTLYFRSKGYKGLGDYDIYKSHRTKQGWSNPINLGSPINTTGTDGALVVSLDGTRGYYATNKYKDEKMEHLDLFEFDLPEVFRPDPMTFVKGRIIDEVSQLPLRANITITKLDGSNYTTRYRANNNGEFLAAIPVGQPTLINISFDGYVFHSDHVYYREVRYSVDPYSLNVGLSKVENIVSSPEPSMAIVLKNIFFESGSATLLSTSDSEIALLYDLLKNDLEVRIEIIGYTDNVGSELDNLQLSKNRAEAVKKALVTLGAIPSRVKATGKGEQNPIDSNDTEEGRSNNRRTEFLIVK